MLEPIEIPEAYTYHWQHFFSMRGFCGKETTLHDIKAYTEMFAPSATAYDKQVLCTMNVYARSFVQELEDGEAVWPEDE